MMPTVARGAGEPGSAGGPDAVKAEPGPATGGGGNCATTGAAMAGKGCVAALVPGRGVECAAHAMPGATPGAMT